MSGVVSDGPDTCGGRLSRRRLLRSGVAFGAGAGMAGRAGADDDDDDGEPNSAEDPGPGKLNQAEPGWGISGRTRRTRISAGDGESSRFLVVRDCEPWYGTANETVLKEQDRAYEIIGSDGLSDETLSEYGAVLLPSTQDADYYETLIAARDRIESFVRDGGVLIAHVTDSGYPCSTVWQESFLPKDVTHEQEYIDLVTVGADDAELLTGLSGDDLDGWNYSLHGYLTDIPEDATVVTNALIDGSVIEPAYIEYRVGSGRVLASTHTMEWPFVTSFGSEQLLRNEIRYAAGLAESGLRPTNVSLLQNVTGTRLLDNFGDEVGPSYTDPDPVAGKSSTILFELDGPNPRLIDELDDDPLRVTIEYDDPEDGPREFTLDLSAEVVGRLERGFGDNVAMTWQEIRDDVLVETPEPPTFRPTGGGELTVSIDPDIDGDGEADVDTEDATVPAAAFRFRETEPLRLGIVELEDQTGGDDFGDPDTGRLSTTDDRTPREQFAANVDAIGTAIRDYYPVPDAVEIRTLDRPLASSTRQGISEKYNPLDNPDLLKRTVDRAYNEFINEDGELTVDEVVVVAPDGPDGSDSYLEARDRDRAVAGVHHKNGDDHPQYASLVEANLLSATDPSGTGATAAHEIGHHLLPEAAYRSDAARREPADDDANCADDPSLEIDRDHVRGVQDDCDRVGLKSTALEYREGLSIKPDRSSFMSYDGAEGPDSITVGKLTERGELGWRPSVPVEDLDYEGPVASGNGVVGEDGFWFGDYLSVPSSRPQPDDEEGQVEVTAVAPDGSELAARTTATGIKSTGSGGAAAASNGDGGFFSFAVPFPERTSELRFEAPDRGLEAAYNPLSAGIRDLLRRVPDAAFVPDADGQREALLDRLDAVDRHVEEERFRAAVETMEGIQTTLESVLEGGYPTRFADEPTKSEVVDSVRDQVDRLGTLRDEYGRGGKAGDGNGSDNATGDRGG